jgi:8-oxo-dGTP pyrophosphatase MutT (NUDIX family)
MKKHPKKISEEIMHENPWWTYKHDTLEKPQGGMGDYYYGETSGMAMVIPVMPDGRLVLVLQHRYLEDKQSIEFPAGGIPNAMEPIAAAQKELLEETGCIADDYVKLGVIQSSNGLLKDKGHIFLAYVTEQQEQNLDELEDIEVLYRRPDEVDQMVRKNEIWCGQSLAAWALVHHYFLHKD